MTQPEIWFIRHWRKCLFCFGNRRILTHIREYVIINSIYDKWWRHNMETLCTVLALCDLSTYIMLDWTIFWVYNRLAGIFGRRDAHVASVRSDTDIEYAPTYPTQCCRFYPILIPNTRRYPSDIVLQSQYTHSKIKLLNCLYRNISLLFFLIHSYFKCKCTKCLCRVIGRMRTYIDDLVQDYSISIANTQALLQSCTKSLMYDWIIVLYQWLLTRRSRNKMVAIIQTVSNRFSNILIMVSP